MSPAPEALLRYHQCLAQFPAGGRLPRRTTVTKTALARDVLCGRRDPLRGSVIHVECRRVRRHQDRDDREDRVAHHHQADIDKGAVDACAFQHQPGEDRDQPAAIDLRDLIAEARPRCPVAGREVLRVEGRDRAVAEAEHEAEPDDFGDHRKDEDMRVDQVEIRDRENEEDHGRDQQNDPAIHPVGHPRAHNHEHEHRGRGNQADRLGL